MGTATQSASADHYFAPRRLGHVNLWVTDINVSERFYNDICGLTVDFTEPDLVAHSVYMFDPDMNCNELCCDTVKNWRSVRRAAKPEPTKAGMPLAWAV